jgi:hypothetical protein
MTRDDVRAYYQGCGDREWMRLATAEGNVEFAVNAHAIASYLPPGARVLDIGGGPDATACGWRNVATAWCWPTSRPSCWPSRATR